MSTRKNRRGKDERFTVCLCEICNEVYEPSIPHKCREENSYPVIEPFEEEPDEK